MSLPSKNKENRSISRKLERHQEKQSSKLINEEAINFSDPMEEEIPIFNTPNKQKSLEKNQNSFNVFYFVYNLVI